MIACAVALLATPSHASLQEAFQQAPTKLDADVSATGIVMLDFSLGPEKGLPYLVQGARVRGTAEGSREIYAPKLVVSHETVGVLFAGLPPGRYRVVQVLDTETSIVPGFSKLSPVPRQQTTINRWDVADSSLDFDVREGGLTYVGPFQVITHKRATRIVERHDPTRERAVWRAVERKYSPSPWDAILARRIAELDAVAEGAPSGGAASAASAADSSHAATDSAAASSIRPETPPPDTRKVFENIVVTDKLGSFGRRAGPTGTGGSLIVTRDSLRYVHRKSAFALAARQLRAVSRENHWIAIDFEQDGAVVRRWLGFGLYNDFEITDQLEYSLAGLQRRGVR